MGGCVSTASGSQPYQDWPRQPGGIQHPGEPAAQSPSRVPQQSPPAQPSDDDDKFDPNFGKFQDLESELLRTRGRSPPLADAARGAAEEAQKAAAEASAPPREWTRGDLIGRGAFGEVYLGLDMELGQLMAVKQLNLSHMGPGARASEHEAAVLRVEKEVNFYRRLSHPHIVRYLGTERTKEHFNIFLEYVPGGSIASLLAKFGSFKETVVRIYTRQILEGLQYLHTNKIMHRDIKGANILVETTGLVKLADFGACKQIEDLVTIESGHKSMAGTPNWMAPEVIKQTGAGRQADIWSVACTVLEMLTGKPPWPAFNNQAAAVFHIGMAKGGPPLPEGLSPECRDFLNLCFNRNPKERPNAARLLKHPFLQSAPKSHALATPLTNISIAVDTFAAPSGASTWRMPAGPVSPVPEEPAASRQWTAAVAQASAPAPAADMREASPGRGGDHRNNMSSSQAHAAAQLPLIDLGSSPEGTLDDSLALPPAVSSAAPAAECSDRNDLAEQKASRKHADEDAEEDEAGDPAEHVPLNDDEYVVNGSDSAGASPADGTATRAGDERPANEDDYNPVDEPDSDEEPWRRGNGDDNSDFLDYSVLHSPLRDGIRLRASAEADGNVPLASPGWAAMAVDVSVDDWQTATNVKQAPPAPTLLPAPWRRSGGDEATEPACAHAANGSGAVQPQAPMPPHLEPVVLRTGAENHGAPHGLGAQPSSRHGSPQQPNLLRRLSSGSAGQGPPPSAGGSRPGSRHASPAHLRTSNGSHASPQGLRRQGSAVQDVQVTAPRFASPPPSSGGSKAARLRISASGSKLAAMAATGGGASEGGLTATEQLIRALSPQDSEGRQGFGAPENISIGGDADDIMAFVRHKASSDWRRLRVSLPFAPGELTASLASAVKEIRDQTSPDSAVVVEAEKQQQWQAELEDELSRERQNRRQGAATAARRPSTSPQHG